MQKEQKGRIPMKKNVAIIGANGQIARLVENDIK